MQTVKLQLIRCNLTYISCLLDTPHIHGCPNTDSWAPQDGAYATQQGWRTCSFQLHVCPGITPSEQYSAAPAGTPTSIRPGSCRVGCAQARMEAGGHGQAVQEAELEEVCMRGRDAPQHAQRARRHLPAPGAPGPLHAECVMPRVGGHSTAAHGRQRAQAHSDAWRLGTGRTNWNVSWAEACAAWQLGAPPSHCLRTFM